MSCFLFFATVLRLSNPMRGRPCLNTRLSLHRVHSSAPLTLTYTQGGRPGNVWGQGPVSPSVLTDWLARVRYLRAIWVFFKCLSCFVHNGFCVRTKQEKENSCWSGMCIKKLQQSKKTNLHFRTFSM